MSISCHRRERTALVNACRNLTSDVARCPVDESADLNATDVDGKTLVHYIVAWRVIRHSGGFVWAALDALKNDVRNSDISFDREDCSVSQCRS